MRQSILLDWNSSFELDNSFSRIAICSLHFGVKGLSNSREYIAVHKNGNGLQPKRTACLIHGNELQCERMNFQIRGNKLQSKGTDCLIRRNKLQSKRMELWSCLIRGNELPIHWNELLIRENRLHNSI